MEGVDGCILIRVAGGYSCVIPGTCPAESTDGPSSGTQKGL